MTTRFKEFFLGILFGLSLTLFYVGKGLLGNIPQIFHQTKHRTLTDRSLRFQPHGAVKMGMVGNGPWPDGAPDGGGPGGRADYDFDDDTLARNLSKQVRILVWVMTTPKNLDTKALAIKQTWGKRCNVIIFFSSETDIHFPTIDLGVSEGRDHLTGKTMAAFRYIYENHYNDADWFMKADDDTYVILENLRYFLFNKITSEPVYYGHLFKPNVKQGYYSGGSGYVISKEALRRFGEEAINSTLCREDGGDEDVEFGLCMEKLQVHTSRSMDEIGKSLFHPFHPEIHILGNFPSWYYKYTVGIAQKGFGVSKYAVSFHYVPPDDMRVLDFYLYYMRPYGLHSRTCSCCKSKQR